ncbi:serine/threonine-protein kinase [uncultured Nocardioides sp.]|uniref:serine/threonine-protein kinase n=1 Tax=uncultured Nocardioides sp. TaxID=198441 RepID=UPI002615554A|nr:serine/threonine-protein kinase [uncultured Nocardioides sp.]
MPAPETPSRRIGGFRLLRGLGAGGMGVVHVAWDEALQREVALKVLAPHLSADDEFRRRFAREARTQAGLDSDHVLPVLATGEDAGRLWIATPLVRDGDLGSLVEKQGPLPPALALDVVSQVAEGLEDAHRAGLLHRDIKPANVLVRRRGDALHAYLADFGIARGVDDRFTRTGVLVGSPTYMAPELHRGEVAGVGSDVYAVGLLLWILLVGSPPWTGTDYEVARGHVEGAVPRLAGRGPLVEGLNRLLGRALAKSPADRHPDVGALRADLREVTALVAEGTPTAAPAPRPVVRPEPRGPRRGRRAALVVAAVLVVVVVAATGVALWPSDDGEPGGEAGPSDGSPSATDAPTSDLTAAGEDPARRQQAIDNLTAAFETETGDESTARCTAEQWVDDVGVDRLVENDALDDDLQPTDTDVSEYDADVRSSLTLAGIGCGLSG